jgi:hypothetical protein
MLIKPRNKPIKSAAQKLGQEAETIQPPPAKLHSFPPPARGIVRSDNFANQQPAGAEIMENWFPTQRGARVRGGLLKRATVGTGANQPVTALVPYQYGTNRKLFAACNGKLYDVTSVADPAVIPATPVIATLTSTDLSYVQHSSAAGNAQLLVFNGSDLHWVYNGTTWVQNSPAITGVSSAELVNPWVYKSRIFTVKAGTLQVVYLTGAGAIGGAVGTLNLATVYRRGGQVAFGATWSTDSGNGLTDVCAIFSSEGEVAIYSGSDPGNPADWSLVGRYDIGKPLGPQATMRVGGDLAVATVDGLTAISSAVSRDIAALSTSSLSLPIRPDWERDVIERSTFPWVCVKWPAKQMGLIVVPAPSGQKPYCYVVNLVTGAWSRYTKWSMRSAVEWNGWLYLGSTDGKVYQAEVGGTDDGELYYCPYVGLFENLGSPGTTKVALEARATFISSTPFEPRISIGTNYIPALGPYPDSPLDTASDVWDIGLWDIAKWDGSRTSQVTLKWLGVEGAGQTFAPQVQIASGSINTPDIEIVSFDLLYEESAAAGGAMV